MSDLAGSEQLLSRNLEILFAALRGRGDAIKALEVGQSAWETYRDLHCDYLFISGGSNTMGGSDQMWCLADMNRERAGLLASEAGRWVE